MKKKACSISMLLLALFGTAGAKEINILFMGNSFTFRHDLPQLVKTVFEEGHPDLTVHVEIIGYGGQDLFRHHDLYFSESTVRLNTITVPEIEAFQNRIQSFLDMQEAPDFYNAYWEKTGLKPVPWNKCTRSLESALKKQGWLMDRVRNNRRVKWDYVVLQSWQDVVEASDAGYAEYAKKFAKIAEQEGAQVILYITAPYAQNQASVKEPLNPEETKMQMEAIHHLTEELKPCAVVPVALGIEAIQEGGTDLKFRYVNDFHPNQYTAFLTANMFYAAFFKESPEGFRFNTVVENNDKGAGKGKDPDGGNAKVVFDDATKELLQKISYDSVVQFNSGLK